MSFHVGFETENIGASVWKGGEQEALIRLDRHLERKVCTTVQLLYLYPLMLENFLLSTILCALYLWRFLLNTKT